MTVCVFVRVCAFSFIINHIFIATNIGQVKASIGRKSMVSKHFHTALSKRGAELTTDTNGHFPCHILDEAVRQLDTPRPSSAEGGPEGGRAQALLIIFMSPTDSNDHDLWLFRFVLLFLCEVFTHFPCFSMFITLIQA